MVVLRGIFKDGRRDSRTELWEDAEVYYCFNCSAGLCGICRWATAEGYGACLINKPQMVKDMVRHVRSQVDNPSYAVSIKIRYRCLSHFFVQCNHIIG